MTPLHAVITYPFETTVHPNNQHSAKASFYQKHGHARLITESAKEVYMDRVDAKVAKYIEHWNENSAAVNDRTITAWLVSNVMQDIEYWLEGCDPNAAREQAGMADFTRVELIHLYCGLAATASFFGYTVRPDLTGVT